MTILEGRLTNGLARAADFTQIDWVRRQLLALAAIDPHPGTVNLGLQDEDNRSRWRHWRTAGGRLLAPAETTFCHARCFPVRVACRIPAAILLPEVADYPADKVEVVAALPLRHHLGLNEGASVQLELCRPMPAKAVLFDIDGTLVDSIGAYLAIARLAADSHAIEVSEQQVRHALAMGTNFWRDIVPAERADGDAILKAMSVVARREWPRVLAENTKIFAGLAATLAQLHARGLRLGIVSGASSAALTLLRSAGVLDYFEAIVLGTDVAKKKPDPEGIFKCLEKMRVAPADALYVGDAPVDMRASDAAGVRGIGVLTGAADSAMLSREEPHRLLYSACELTEIIEADRNR